MALVLSLKPHEKLFIGGAVIENGTTRAELTVLNDAPILREKEILREQDVSTPATRIYFTIQLMYMDSASFMQYESNLRTLINDFSRAAPSSVSILERILIQLENGRYYNALKICKELITYERMLLENGQIPA